MPVGDIPNFRDAGGLATGSLRRGVVYRSSQLSALTDAQQAHLQALGITIVFDLRTAAETSSRPDRLPAGIRGVHLDVLADTPESGAAAMEQLVAGTGTPDIAAINATIGGDRAHAMMVQTYRDIVSLPSARASYRSMLRDFTESTGSAVVHCTAGKDRTGWGIALFQHIAGVSDDDIVADYLLSSAPITAAYAPLIEQFGRAGGDATALADLIMVRPDYLRSALDTSVAAHGSIDGYLRDGLGLDDAAVAAVRARITA
jgi:protein-tyrosine phosphatase